MDPLSGLPEWGQYLVRGLMIFSVMASSAVVLGRAGRSPYWALLAVVPYFFVVGLWFFALCKWPRARSTT